MRIHSTNIVFLLLVSIHSYCFTLNLDHKGVLEIQNNVIDNNAVQSKLRIIRQTFGYPSVQSRDQTVIVVPNSGSSSSQRGIPTMYNANRASPTVIVKVPDDNYYPGGVGRRYIGSANRL